MNSNSREEILKRIRKGLHRLAIVRGKDENISPSLSSYKETQQKLENLRKETIERKSFLVDTFVNEITKVSGKAFSLKSEDEIKDYVIRLVEEHSAKFLAIWESDFLKQINLREFLEIKGLKFASLNSKEEMAKADIGITEADFGIADTGTIVLTANEKQPRSVSLIPPVHIAIIKSDVIVENLKDLFVLLTNTISQSGSLTNLTSCITFITGPSRTGDIELNIILGVHGPKELFVLICHT
ncbi:MAG: LutC/YkgG family protein [Thermodesulfobacteriota bacterium]